MRNLLIGASALVGAALLANTAVQAAGAKYVPIAMPNGAVTVLPFGINDNNIVAGGYTDGNGVLHGFYGPPDGSNYVTFDMDDGSTPEARAILNDGSITGLALGNGFTFGEEFYRSPSGKIKLLKDPNGNVMDGVVQGGNDKGKYVGDHLDTDFVTRLGFEGKSGRYKSDFVLNVQGVTSTNPRQINNKKDVAGGYIDSSGIQHGFVLHNGKLITFDAPNSVGVTTAEGINDSMQVSGLYTDDSANRHAFVYDARKGTYTILDPGDGSTAQEAWGINNAGLVVMDTDSGTTPYIYCPKGATCPAGASAVVHRVNNKAVKHIVAIP